jgi:hypothetical protein
MATIGYTRDGTHVLTDGLSTWKIKRGTEDKHYSLGVLQDGKLVLSLLTEDDTLKRPRGISVKVDASAKCLNTDKTNLLPILHLLGNGSFDHQITGLNAKTFSGSLGLTWKFVSDADLDKARYLQVNADGIILIDSSAQADLTDLFAAPAADSGEGTTDTIKGLASLASDYTPAGIVKFEVRPAADETFEEIGPIRKGKFTAESLAYKDEHQRSFLRNIEQTIEIDCLATSAEFAFLKSSINLDYKITFTDGMVMTFNDVMGTAWEAHLDTDSDDVEFIKFTAKGRIAPTSWAAQIS